MNNLALKQDSWTCIETQRPELYFNELIDKYRQDLSRYAYWLSGDRHIAEDLVQETFLRAWRALDKLKNPKAVKGWLMTIVRRENARRFERYQPQESDIPLDSLASKDRAYDTSTEAFVMRQAIQKLPEDYRKPLLLQVLGGFSQKEIATELGISSAGVGTRLFRARNKLRSLIEE